MSFNVFSPGEPEPGEALSPQEALNSWESRAPLQVRTIARYQPDLIGFQEMEPVKLATYRTELTAYEALQPAHPDELPSIFWLRDRWELVESGQFWLSDTPDVRGADWDASDPLPVEWVRLRIRGSDIEILHINTQFEDGPWGERSRRASSRLLIERAAALRFSCSAPVILTGDFNCNPWTEPYRLFIEAGFVDTYRAAGHADSVDSSTFHGLQGQEYFALEWGDELFWRVDWILTGNSSTTRLQTVSCTIVRDAAPPVYPSDHYPCLLYTSPSPRDRG
jgi:endonuclease/exonuclease/phosphatase family metal-dependent hydrolase